MAGGPCLWRREAPIGFGKSCAGPWAGLGLVTLCPPWTGTWQGPGSSGTCSGRGPLWCLKDPPGHLRAWAGPDLEGPSFRGHSQGQEGPSLAAGVGPVHFTHAVWRLCTSGTILTPRKLRYMLPDLLPPILRPPGTAKGARLWDKRDRALVLHPPSHKGSRGGRVGWF